jgi:hypothetical protein
MTAGVGVALGHHDQGPDPVAHDVAASRAAVLLLAADVLT